MSVLKWFTSPQDCVHMAWTLIVSQAYQWKIFVFLSFEFVGPCRASLNQAKYNLFNKLQFGFQTLERPYSFRPSFEEPSTGYAFWIWTPNLPLGHIGFSSILSDVGVFGGGTGLSSLNVDPDTTLGPPQLAVGILPQGLLHLRPR